MDIDKSLLKNLSILYVEDDNTIRNELASLLTNFFKKVFTAADGEEGLSTFKSNQNKIDLIISDITMPKLTGIEMLKEIRKFDKEIAVIFTTAYSDKEFLIDSIKLKIFNYIVKPIDIKGLLLCVSDLAQILNSKKIIIAKNRELKKYKEAIDTNNIIIKIDTKMNITYVNKHFSQITGFDKKELIGKEFKYLSGENIDNSLYDKIYSKILNNKIWKGKLKQITKENIPYLVEAYSITTFDDENNYDGAIIIQKDITEDSKKQRKIQMALLKEKSDIFIKSKEGFAKKSLEINELENRIVELENRAKINEIEKEKYILLLQESKDNSKKLKLKLENYEKKDFKNQNSINLIKIEKENETLKSELYKLTNQLNDISKEYQKKEKQIKIINEIKIDDLEKELSEYKNKLKELGSIETFSKKIEYWKEKSTNETKKLEELETKIMNYASKDVLTKIFGSK